jgi:hypothetical protein
MTYEESFLSSCDAEGNAPTWAINQIFDEHGSQFQEFIKHTPPQQWFSGEAILEWLGY